MGCTPSKVLAPLEGSSPFTQLTDAEAAAKLDWFVGTSVAGSDETKKAALMTLDKWFRKRIPRSISKKFDLLTSVAHDGTMDAALKKALGAAIKDNDCLSSLASALDTLHERAFPKMCLGLAGLYHKNEGQKPWRYAFEQGCRMYDVMAPFQPEIKRAFDSMGMSDEFKTADDCYDEFSGFDTSDLCIFAGVMPFVMQGQDDKAGPHLLRTAVERLRKEKMVNYEEEHGSVVDILMVPLGAMSFPDFKMQGPFSDYWREAEKLVDEGLVRGLATNAFTIHQLEALIGFAKHRPVVVTFESSIHAPMPDMVAFCKENRMLPRAHVALCKGDVLDSECLKRSDMTPAQAALKWHVQQGVVPCFGNDTLAHIEENMKVQTAELMALPPTVAPKPARNVLKLLAMMEMQMPGVMCKDGTREDTGILRKDEDGRFWLTSSREAGDKFADQLAKMTDGEASLISEIETAIEGGMKRDSKCGHERRMGIAKAINGLGSQGLSVDEATTATTDQMKIAKEAAEANGTDVHEEMGKQMSEDVDAFHSISGASGAKGLVEMVVVPLTTFKSHKQIPRRSFRNKKEHHVIASALGPDDKVLFFSQRWLTPTPRAEASPDDGPGGTKYKQLMAACDAYLKETGTAEKNLYIWLDFSSVDQDDDTLLVKGVNSLALYVCSCDAFVSIDHADYFDRGWCLMECMFADAGKLPRYIFTKENKLKQLTPNMKLENKTPTEGSFTVESDRAIMKVLQVVATAITGRIDRGVMLRASSMGPTQLGALEEEPPATEGTA